MGVQQRERWLDTMVAGRTRVGARSRRGKRKKGKDSIANRGDALAEFKHGGMASAVRRLFDKAGTCLRLSPEARMRGATTCLLGMGHDVTRRTYIVDGSPLGPGYIWQLPRPKKPQWNVAPAYPCLPTADLMAFRRVRFLLRCPQIRPLSNTPPSLTPARSPSMNIGITGADRSGSPVRNDVKPSGRGGLAQWSRMI